MADEIQQDAEQSASAAEATANQPAPQPQKGFWGKVDEWFGITKSGSNYRTEIVAGLTTFMAMVYILMVNAGMFSGVITSDDPYGAAYIATAIGAIIGTLLMAFMAKMPLAQASGMGINAFIVFTLLDKATGLTYANCMVFVLLDGVVFLLLTVTGLRRQIFEAIPAGVRHAIPVGIGMFIAFIGMLHLLQRAQRYRLHGIRCNQQRICRHASRNRCNPRRYSHSNSLQKECKGRRFMGSSRLRRTVLCARRHSLRRKRVRR